MRNLTDSPNVPVSGLYPSGRIKDNTGSGDGTPVDEKVYGDLHQNIWALIRRWGITPNGLPDNTTNGYQIVEALKALPAKNDFVLDIGGAPGLLTIPTKFSLFETGETIICKATVNLGFQASYPVASILRGTTNNVNVNLSIKERFYIGDYVLITRTASGADLMPLVSVLNFNTTATDKGFVKGATEAEEAAAGTGQATTPHTNLYIFQRRVNGDLSGTFLANNTRNGLMSQADKIKLDGIGSDVLNTGWFGNVDIGGGSVGNTYSVSGDVTSATITETGAGRSVIRVVVPNTLGGINYFVQIAIQSMSANINSDVNIQPPIFKPINATTFDIAITETSNVNQSLRLHIRTIKI